MRFKSILFLTFLIFAAFIGSAQAYSYGYSYIEHMPGDPTVYAETGTVLDYNTWLYYDAGIQGFMYKDNFLTASTERIIPVGAATVSVWTEPEAVAGSNYRIQGDHYVRAYYYYYSGGTPHYIDYYGYGFYSGTYPSPYSFLQGPSGYYTTSIYKVATTTVDLTVPRPVPHLSSIDLTGGQPGYDYTTMLRGSGLFGPNQNITVSGSGVTATVRPNQLPNQIEVLEIDIHIAPDASIGDHNISLTVAGQTSNSVVFRVGDNTPTISYITPPEGNTGESVPVTIVGSGFGLNPNLQIDGSGVTPTITSATSTEIRAVFSVADLTYAGNRNVRVTSRGVSGNGFQSVPGNSDTSDSKEFSVFKPTVTIDPFDSVEKNGKRDVTVRISGAKSNTVFRAFMRTGQYSGNMVFDSNGQAGIDLIGNGVKTLKIKSVGSESNRLDDWEFIVTGDNIPSKVEPFTVTSVAFEEAAACTGFDKLQTPAAYLMVPKDGSNTVKARIVPEGATGSFMLAGVEQGGVTPNPTTVSGNQPVTITVTAGSNTGDFTIKATGNEAADPASNLKASVRKKITRSIVMYAVKEDNDDVQAIAVGKGQADQIAIEPNTTFLFSGQVNLRGDDQIVKMKNTHGRVTNVITTGADGIRQSSMDSSDREIIPFSQGKPDSSCVLVGANHFSDTNVPPSVDDHRDASDNILSGPDGICQATANNTDIPVPETSIPAATALRDYLNDISWYKQANVFFTVTRGPDAEINFDMNGDGLVASDPAELGQIGSALNDTDATSFHLYFTGMNMALNSAGNQPFAFTYVPTGETLFSQNHNGTRVYQIAHEVGHLLGRGPHSPEAEDLMSETDDPTSPCRIRKPDWDLVNSLNP
jgi:hypothetical protein